MARPDAKSGATGRILVFGSINVDLVCRAPKIPAPGETILAPTYEIFAGGKGANQAVSAARAGAHVAMIAATGGDAFSAIPVSALRTAGVDTSMIQGVDAPTGAAFITVSHDGENAITVASGANRLVTAAMIEPRQWPAITHVLLQGELDWQQSKAVAEQARQYGKCVVLNAAPSLGFDPAILPFVDYLVVNVHELRDVAGMLKGVETDIDSAGLQICKQTGCCVIVTRGAEGVSVFLGNDLFHEPAHRVEVVDTTGAGDTFCGVFTAMLAQQLDIRAAIKRAAIAGGLACTRHGAQSAMPSLADIEQFEARQHRPRSQG